MVGKRGTSRTYRCPPDHKHDKSGTCFNQHGCGCFPCVEGRRIYQLERDRALAYGRWQSNRSVDATGTRRRLQALAFMGWPSALLAEHVGTRDTHIRMLAVQDRCTPHTRDRVTEVYEHLWNQTPPGGPRKYTANMARRKGWVGPLHWDDIDTDPEPPHVETDPGPVVDSIKVERALRGEKHPLNYEEKREVVRIGHSRRWADTLIAHRVGIVPETVARIRGELGLVAWPNDVLIDRSDAA